MTREIPEFDGEEVESRYKFLKDLFLVFIEKHPLNDLDNRVYLNFPILSITAKSIADDLWKYEKYSNSPKADNHKEAAYHIKWISKLKPIQIKSDPKDLKPSESTIDLELLLINSSFSLFTGFTFLKNGVSEKISNKLYDHLIYTTYYRTVSGRNMSALLYALEQSCEGNIP